MRFYCTHMYVVIREYFISEVYKYIYIYTPNSESLLPRETVGRTLYLRTWLMLTSFLLFSYHKSTNTIIPPISLVYSTVAQHVVWKSLDIPKN